VRIGVIPDHLLERAALMAGLVPTPLVLSFFGMGHARALLTGMRLGVFEALADGARTAEEIAATAKTNPAGTAVLLSALNGFGYLARRDGRFTLSRSARKWFLRGKKGSLHDAMMFVVDLWDWMGALEDAVRTGKTLDLHASGRPPEFWERYMRGLASFARIAAPEVVRKTALAAAPARLLDVGGGHGVYSEGFCRRYPRLSAEVLDLPEACAHGRRIVAEDGFQDRVRHREGDLRTAAWGEGYDVVLIFNVLHNSTGEEATAICRRAHAALRPGGTLAILDGEHRDRRGDVDQVGGFNELFFFVVSGTRAYTEETMRGWMRDAGFAGLRTRRLLFAPAVLLTGTKA
jgi:2-polyprenyl-3-methyl-5-hydroxy-6-metoxy-1,4-benzoquinol methylase